MLEKWIRGSSPPLEADSDAARSGVCPAAEKPGAAPPIEIERALDNLGGDQELFRDVLAMFVKTFPKKLEELREACTKVDSQKLADLAHSLKGSASNICAEPTRRLAVRMEELVKHGEALAAVSLLSDLEASFEQLREFSAAISPPA